ncbi:MAG: AAA family ATPase [Proteobacteria bacterium]|nr:AAA family ATPase [Pseudomonadota bacterium]MBU4471160.1 AAA family ATPase [Pseudomonadota bacterium]MCG2751833.1 AAA family ATPase [Desulfobacteraceae bacterium]
MKKQFAITKNVKRFTAAVKAVTSCPAGIDRMCLVYGDPGLGKSETAIWWVNTFGGNSAYIRTKKLMSGRWLLEEIVSELGVSPAYKTSELFNQAVEALAGTDRVVILDEVDYLAHDARVIETIRDIHDTTGSPFVFIGMDQADKKLKRFRHLWRRFSQVVRYEPLDKEDITAVLIQICEVEIEDQVFDYIATSGDFTVSALYRWSQRIEYIAKRNNLSRVSLSHLTNGDRK